MKTVKVRPVLVPTKDTESILVIDDNSRRLHICKPNEAAWGHQQIVLISLDPDDKIDISDWYIAFGNVKTYLLQCKEVHNGFLVATDTTKYPFDMYKCKKVIATQDQLSPELINQLVSEYNNGGMQDFEIEMK